MTADAPERRAHGNRPTDDQLLDAAVKIIAASGFDAITMDEIAQRSGTTKPTLYAHFGSKDALFARLLDRELGELRRRLYTAADANPIQVDNSATSIRARLEPVFTFAAERPDGMRILLDPTSPGVMPRIQTLMTEAVERGLAEFTAMLRDAGEEARTMATILVPMIAAALAAGAAAAIRHGTDPAQAVELTADFVAAGSAAALLALNRQTGPTAHPRDEDSGNS